ncbi:FAD/NAD(P)-binding domain-containing protein [Cylindrobasidium torrendii FP15055 ss-10]|uniref:FAD/NAD(P)-binding domain-containing protein n=1 Tax=Cylindrobasidium torrendii FP15055 ss-10 TaxID=1314674 RepID=A0A0D7B4J8_9AGAR|nr:FAD/NAD(P)-binding domain-containing protein [Cylindrobasidium torrendii FP15055 ss-10]
MPSENQTTGSPSPSTMHFVVVGASVAGLAAGMALGGWGHTVTIVETDSQDACENRPMIGAAGLLPNTTRLLLKFPGGKEYLEEHGTKMNELRFVDIDNNATKGRIVFDPEIIEDLGADYYLIPHHDLTAYLRAQCHRLGCTIRYDFAVKGIETSKQGPAVVEGVDEERIECDVIIGADGTTSVVRDFMVKQAEEPRPKDEDEDSDESDDDGSITGGYSAAHLPGQYSPECVGGVTMIPVEKLAADPDLRHLLDLKSLDAYTGAGYALMLGRHGPYYMIEMAALRPAKPDEKDVPWRQSVPAQSFFAPYVPKDNLVLQKLLALTEDAYVTIQPIVPMSSFVDYNARAVLVGTSAHCVPVHATHTASLPLEDCFTLGRLLEKIPALTTAAKEGGGDEAVRRANVALLFRGYDEIRAPRSLQLAESDMKALGLTSLVPGPMRDVFNKILKASLTMIPGEGVLDQDEVGGMWADWVSQANYDAQDAVDEWWHLYGKFAMHE